jgi:hypothetical protein
MHVRKMAIVRGRKEKERKRALDMMPETVPA